MSDDQREAMRASDRAKRGWTSINGHKNRADAGLRKF